MENATKALLIIGATMLAILTLTIGVYMMGKFGNASDTYVTKLDIIELQKYNSNFEVFIGRNDITAQEIVSVASIAVLNSSTCFNKFIKVCFCPSEHLTI